MNKINRLNIGVSFLLSMLSFSCNNAETTKNGLTKDNSEKKLVFNDSSECQLLPDRLSLCGSLSLRYSWHIELLSPFKPRTVIKAIT